MTSGMQNVFECSVGDIAASVSETHNFEKAKLIFLNTSDILHGTIRHNTYSPVIDMPGQAKKSIRRDDILLSEIRPANGRWALVDLDADDFVVSTKLMVIRCDVSRVLPEYMYAFLTSTAISTRLQQIAESRSGTFPQITFEEVARLKLRLPPLEEQRRIAGVLGALDDLIEVNRGLIRDLETLGLTSLLAKLPFESREIDGGVEKDGWTYVSLLNATSVIETGSRPKGGVRGISRGVPSIGAESIDGLAKFNFDKVKYVSEEFFENMNKGHLSSGDVLVYKDGGTPGSFTPKVAMFGEGFPYDRMAINEHVFRVRASAPISNAYLYFWLKTERMMAEMHRAGTGAAIPGINKSSFSGLPIAIPPTQIAGPLCASLETIGSAALNIAIEIRQLEQTRDELLPLLMSGRVRVSEVAA